MRLFSQLSKSLFCFALVLLIAGNVYAKPYTPKPGSVERKAILNALRIPVQREAKQAVTFYGVDIKAQDGWAWVMCSVRDKAGKKRLFEVDTFGLVRKSKGRWRTLHWGIAGDIGVACDAAKKYPQAPRAIFGGVLSGCP